MNIENIILSAKLGSARKDAQVDTCTAFAAALYDLLKAQGQSCRLVTAVKRGINGWAHAIVQADGRYYDSMGEFSVEIYRKRARVHPTVQLQIEFVPDSREDCYEEEFEGMYEFYLQMLSKAATKMAVGA